MQIVVGANRLPKYWINFLLLSTALHYSALGPQNLGDSGRRQWNAMWKICILCKKLWKMWKFLWKTIISLPWCVYLMMASLRKEQEPLQQQYINTYNMDETRRAKTQKRNWNYANIALIYAAVLVSILIPDIRDSPKSPGSPHHD